MARNSEFYKGRRKKRSYAIIPAAVIIGIIVLTIVLFYSMQQYAVISKEGVSVELPILKSEENTTVDSEGNVVKVFDPVDSSITFDDPDYSGIEAQVGEDVPAMRAIYVSSENITQDKLNEYADRLSVGNALVLEMKPVSGNLMWNSQAQAAVNYGLYVETEQTRQIPELIAGLKAREDKDIYLVAEINVCRDALYASRSTTVCLRTELGGNYTDDEGAWLDPYNTELRQYVIDMCNELYDMGKDVDFGKKAEYLTPIRKAPFYAVARQAGVLCTLNGLLTDVDMRVIDADRNVIPGLYAVGNCQGGWFGGLEHQMMVPGMSLGRAATTGRVAAKRACGIAD